MTSSTEQYLNMQHIYQAKAEADFLAIGRLTRSTLKIIGRDPNSIPRATIKSFCKNARKLKKSYETKQYKKGLKAIRAMHKVK
ncbi:NEDD8-activating enzyme E1 regulatory subunit AXR1-like [Cicer arietinum]|uniref:NEDD8-activating enzyme E1 regulatory subunit AXR1-like n=1 Tax=Cicer arietinum TaxID=3827 RepID=UPI003CC5CE8D